MLSNKSVYEASAAIATFDGNVAGGLYESEKIAFRYIDSIERQSVLDIGVGAGRTTPYLSSRFANYLGIDYSAPLVELASRNFPAQQFLVMDATRLQMAEEFDCIVFSYNGIDYIDTDGRRAALDGITAHLRHEGLLIYSTHNLHYRRVERWMNSLLVKEIGWGKPLVRNLPNRLRRFWWQQRLPFSACVNDPGLNFSLLTRYADIAREQAELGSRGYLVLAAIGANKSTATYDEDDSWVYIVAKKIR